MNKVEKIEVMFESILAELEKLTKALKDSSSHMDDSDDGLKILDAINELQDKLTAQKVSVDLGDLEQKFETIRKDIESKGSSFVTKEKHHHYFWFFPDLKEWFSMISKAKLIWFIAIVLAVSLGLNYYFGKDYQSLRNTTNKYDLLKFSDQPISIQELDSLWKDEQWRKEKLEFIEAEREKALFDTEKKQRLEELRNELNNLEEEEKK